jgi:hypothetical protein
MSVRYIDLKSWLIISICCFGLNALKLSAQHEQKFFNGLKNMDMMVVEFYLSDKTDITIIDDQQILSRKPAVSLLKNFLDLHKPQSWELMHTGSSKDKTSQYKVVKLYTIQGTFRVFVYTNGPLTTSSIKEIRIDEF